MKKKCLIATCKRPPKHRGMCVGCYTTAWRLVRDGKTTWDDLIQAGVAGSSQRKKSPLVTQFNKGK